MSIRVSGCGGEWFGCIEGNADITGMRMIRVSIKELCFVVLSGLLACSPSLYIPTKEIAQLKNQQIENLHLGRQLFIGHCGSCHRLYLPAQFSVSRWNTAFNSMQSRAKINDSQKLLIRDYILSGK